MKYGFVVEGTHDEDKLLSVLPNALCVVTRGTRLDNRVKSEVTAMSDQCDQVFLLVDPDDAGDAIEQMIHNFFPQIKRISLDRNHCLCYRGRKVKVGVEHCRTEYLSEVLLHYVSTPMGYEEAENDNTI